jgi:hypothetical protein
MCCTTEAKCTSPEHAPCSCRFMAKPRPRSPLTSFATNFPLPTSSINIATLAFSLIGPPAASISFPCTVGFRDGLGLGFSCPVSLIAVFLPCLFGLLLSFLFLLSTGFSVCFASPLVILPYRIFVLGFSAVFCCVLHCAFLFLVLFQRPSARCCLLWRSVCLSVSGSCLCSRFGFPCGFFLHSAFLFPVFHVLLFLSWLFCVSSFLRASFLCARASSCCVLEFLSGFLFLSPVPPSSAFAVVLWVPPRSEYPRRGTATVHGTR